MADHIEPSGRQYMRNYRTASPELLQAYMDFGGAVFAEEGRNIAKRYRELMAVAVSISKQCPYCIDRRWGPIHARQGGLQAGAARALDE